MPLDMLNSVTNPGAQFARLRIGRFRGRAGIHLDREQVRPHFVMQVARDTGAFFFLDILNLLLQTLVAVGKSRQPFGHVVEPMRQCGKLWHAPGVEAHVIAALRHVPQTRLEPAQETERTRSGDWDIVTHSFSMQLEPGTELKQWFGSETAEDSSPT